MSMDVILEEARKLKNDLQNLERAFQELDDRQRMVQEQMAFFFRKLEQEVSSDVSRTRIIERTGPNGIRISESSREDIKRNNLKSRDIFVPVSRNDMSVPAKSSVGPAEAIGRLTGGRASAPISRNDLSSPVKSSVVPAEAVGRLTGGRASAPISRNDLPSPVKNSVVPTETIGGPAGGRGSSPINRNDSSVSNKVNASQVEARGQLRCSAAQMKEIADAYEAIDLCRNEPEKRKARTAFINTYSIQGYKCANFQARIHQPALEPKFTPAASLWEDANFWVANRAGYAIVVPRHPITYEERIHLYGGMKELFESDYSTGSFNKVRLKRVAVVIITGDLWTVKIPGLLGFL